MRNMRSETKNGYYKDISGKSTYVRNINDFVELERRIKPYLYVIAPKGTALNDWSRDGKSKEFTSEYQDATKIDTSKGFYNYKEVVYSRLVNYRQDGDKENKFSVATPIETFDVVKYQADEREKALRLAQAEDKEKEKAEDKINVVMQGYCRFKNDIEVTNSYDQLMADYEKKLIMNTLLNSKSKAEAAKKLNITRQNLNYKLEKLGLKDN